MAPLLQIDASSLVAWSDYEAQTKQGAVLFSDPSCLLVHGKDATERLRITNIASPTHSSDAVTKEYVDLMFDGLRVKQACRVATIEDLPLSSLVPGFNVDGVALESGDRILLKDQSVRVQNGVYICDTPPVRSSDALVGQPASGMYLFIDQGDVNRDRSFVCTTDAGWDTIGEHELTFINHSARPTALAGNGLVVSTTSSTALDVDLSKVPLLQTSNHYTGVTNTFDGSIMAVSGIQARHVSLVTDNIDVDPRNAVNIEYLEKRLGGLTWKRPVRAASRMDVSYKLNSENPPPAIRMAAHSIVTNLNEPTAPWGVVGVAYGSRDDAYETYTNGGPWDLPQSTDCFVTEYLFNMTASNSVRTYGLWWQNETVPPVDSAAIRRQMMVHDSNVSSNQQPHLCMNYDMRDLCHFHGFNWSIATEESLTFAIDVWGSNNQADYDDVVSSAEDRGGQLLWSLRDIKALNRWLQLTDHIDGRYVFTCDVSNPNSWVVTDGESFRPVPASVLGSNTEGVFHPVHNMQAYPTAPIDHPILQGAYRYFTFIVAVQSSTRTGTGLPLEVFEMSPNVSPATTPVLQSGSLVDNVTLAINDRVLLLGQEDGRQNGIYTITETGPTRSDDMLQHAQAAGIVTVVHAGQLNGGRAYICVNDADTGSVGAHVLQFLPLNPPPVADDLVGAYSGIVARHTDNSLAINLNTNLLEVTADNRVQIRGGEANAVLGDTSNTFKKPNLFLDQIRATAGLNASSQSTGTLVVDGGIGCSGLIHCDGVMNHSDRDLKKNFDSLGPVALDTIQSINGYEFTWKHSGQRDIGVVAQDVAVHAPLCVTQSAPPDNIMSVNYIKLIPYLVESVKSLKRTIDDLLTREKPDTKRRHTEASIV